MINEPEAQRVREIFAICEQAGTLAEGLREVNARGLTSKQWRSRGGAPHAGKAFSKSLLSRLLTNVLYKGSISHKGTIYAGEHEGIVEPGMWEKVNRKLALNGVSQVGIKHLRQQALLLNLARCGQCGAELIPTFTRKAGKRHSYYVCLQARRRQGCRQRPVAIEDLESSTIASLWIRSSRSESFRRFFMALHSGYGEQSLPLPGESSTEILGP